MIDEKTQSTAHAIRAQVGLMTEEEMAAVLQLTSVSTLATWRSQKKGPAAIKLGKKIFYSLTDFAEWAKSEVQKQAANDNTPPAQEKAA